jgi:anthranilate phosphoribosyltransferase
MRHVGPTRVELGTRTIFNLLGPLSNPASVTRQLVGVFDAKWVRPLAEVLQQLGSKSVWVVHGDGLDEMTVTGETLVAELKNGEVREFSVTPQDAGLDTHSFEDLKGGDAEYNAEALRDVLNGAKNAYRDIVLLNAAGSLIVAGKVSNLMEGAGRAAQSIDSGAAKTVLERLVLTSNIENA